MKCLDCSADEGIMLTEFSFKITKKEFQEAPEKSYSFYELSEMTEVCSCCGSENIEIDKTIGA